MEPREDRKQVTIHYPNGTRKTLMRWLRESSEAFARRIERESESES